MTDNVLENRSKNQLGIHKKIFIRSTALYVFHIAELLLTIKTNFISDYSSNPLNEQTVKCFDQFYITA